MAGEPGETKTVDQSAFGYPVRSLAQVKPGEYWVQALLHRYETFKRSDGHTVKLPMDRGEGQQWSRAPGNLYSAPKQIRIDDNTQTGIKITLDKVIPPIRAAERHEVHQAHQDPERAINEVLGATDASRRTRAVAGRIRCASGGSLSARDLSWTLSRPTLAAFASSHPIQI